MSLDLEPYNYNLNLDTQLLSYQHDYHAGNHADVLKHWLLVECLTHMQQKDGAFDYIDTHAGSGVYRLDSALVSKNSEHNDGIVRLLKKPLPDMKNYLDIVRETIDRKQYPGSAGIVAPRLRPGDHGSLYELHPKAFNELNKNCARKRQCHVRQQDGFKGLLSLLPVASHRALVLVDPAYELKEDFQQVVSVLGKAWIKMPNATFMLWYPVVDPDRIERLERDFRKSGIRDVHLYEMNVRDPGYQQGMTGSGVIIINPPWTLKEKAEATLPLLSAALSQDKKSRWRVECLAQE